MKPGLESIVWRRRSLLLRRASPKNRLNELNLYEKNRALFTTQRRTGEAMQAPPIVLERIYPFTKLKTKHHYRLLFVVNGNCRHHKDCWTWKWKLVAVYESVVIQILLMRWIDFFTNKHGCFQKHHTFTI